MLRIVGGAVVAILITVGLTFILTRVRFDKRKKEDKE